MVYEVAREEDEDMWGSFEKNCAIVFEACCYIGKKERMRLVLTGDSGGMGNFQFNRNLGLPFGRNCMYQI